MPLLKNTFQPYFPDPDAPPQFDCGEEYCNLVSSGDIVRQQWYQTPCSASLVVDPQFNDFTLGAEMIVNGNFATNANNWNSNGVAINATACPATVSGWCFNTNRLGHDGTGTDDDSAYQAGLGLVAGNLYQVVWTVQGMTQGSIYTQLGDAAGATQGAVQTTNETFTEYIYYNDSDDVIQFFPSTDFDGNIDSISCKLVTMNEWAGDFWIFDSGSACVPIANASVGRLYNLAPTYLTTGDYYTATYTLNITSGSIRMYVDDGAGGAQTNLQTADDTPGIYTQYFTALQDGTIGFDPSVDFVGCISSVTVQRLRNDYTFELINAAGDSVDVSYLATYTENKIDLNIDFGALREDGVIDFGCFTIFVYDSCLISGDNLVQDGNFSNGDFSEWTRGNGAWQYDMSGGQIEFIFEPLSDNPTSVTNGNFASGDTGWTHDGSWSLSPAGAVHAPGSTTTLSQTILCNPPPSPIQFMRQWFQVVVTGRTAGSITVTISDKTSTSYSVNDTITNFFILGVTGNVTLSINPTSNFDGTITLVAVHETLRAWVWNPQIVNPANNSIVAGNYQHDYDIVSITAPVTGAIGGFVYIQPNVAQAFDTGTGAKSHIQAYVPGNTVITMAAKFLDLPLSIYYPGRVVMDNYSVVRVEPFEATYRSECFNFQDTHADSTLVTAWCDNDALGSTYIDDLGFQSTGYMLQMRLLLRAYNADLDKEVNLAKFGNGNSRVTYAQYEKFWQLITDYLSEPALITLGAMINCTHFTIGETGQSATEYTAAVERFTPGWRGEGDYSLAPALITLRKKIGGMKFNRTL